MKRVYIDGMSCSKCVNHIKEELFKIVEIVNVDVDLDTGLAVITGDPSDESIKNAVIEAGYTVISIA